MGEVSRGEPEETGESEEGDDFVVDDDGEELWEARAPLASDARPQSALSHRDHSRPWAEKQQPARQEGVLRPSTAGPAHQQRPLGTIPGRRSASALMSRQPKARPVSATESEASSASTHVAASRPMSAVSFRPGSALSSTQGDSINVRPSSAVAHCNAAVPAQLRQRPASAMPSSVSTLQAQERTAPSTHTKPSKLLWSWPRLSEMRISAFDGDDDLRDKDESPQQVEIIGAVSCMNTA